MTFVQNLQKAQHDKNDNQSTLVHILFHLTFFSFLEMH